MGDGQEQKAIRNDDMLPLIAKGAALHQAGQLDEAADKYTTCASARA